MNRNSNRNINWLILIILLLAGSLWVDLNNEISVINPFNDTVLFSRNTETKLGLDLRGGLQTLLEADVPAEREIKTEDMEAARNILENRANALGVSEVVMQTAGDRRIVAEFPGVTNPEEVIASLKQTALLEFVDMGTTPVAEGSTIETDFASGSTTAPTPTDPNAAVPTVYHTVMTGTQLSSASVGQDSATGEVLISFVLKSEGAKIFGEYTTNNVGKYLAIVLDKKVLSVPVIQQPITDGQGQISGSFTLEAANTLAVQLRSGALPIPIKIVESRTVGATLGEESVRKSVTAGAIGLGVVILFMLAYYRLPGFVADLALISYALFTLALFKLIPVVLTLPGIAGFILSIGMAVDANILIFERLKEELRNGRTIGQAIDLGWKRAWPSIRDSNTSTLITCLILYAFGSSFGASIVKGFSVTLALGVGVSLFTAIIVTRTFLHLVLDNIKLAEHPRWFGL
ncbi:MAG: protein translocase subunit SecD [Anaerolineales bacterium]